MSRKKLVWLFALLISGPASVQAAEPLAQQIDRLILEKSKGKPISLQTDDAEFLRRVYLDLSGQIPSIEQTRAFLADKASDKRAKLIDQLLNSSNYPKR